MVGITIRNVTKTFGAVRAVDKVSIEVEQGELFFLLGPSGCGKTTLLRVLAGFEAPDAGRVLLGGRDITDVPPHKRNTAMVFQNYALWPHMNVAENLTFGLRMHHVPDAERRRRVGRALETVQMAGYAERLPGQLSGGQQQRIALARALVIEPEVVLLDEPLSNLDAKLRLEMRGHIRTIHDRLALTMVYVTHDQVEALSMADRVAVMREGRVEQTGAPREIYNRPQSRFVAEFIGEANLLPGRITRLDETASVETAAGTLTSSALYDGARQGDSVTCAIRPERLTVLSDGEARANVLKGEVVRTVYLGSHEQYFVRLADGVEVQALEYNLAAPKAQTGNQAEVGCDPADVVLIRTSGAAPPEGEG